jgi:hypothetical protein
MTAHARLGGKTWEFPDATNIRPVVSHNWPSEMLVLLRENDTEVADIRLGQGDFVTVGDAPKAAVGGAPEEAMGSTPEMQEEMRLLIDAARSAVTDLQAAARPVPNGKIGTN